MTAWKDLPRRLLTVGLGVPSIVLILRHPFTSWLFFMGAHLVCLVEWRGLLPGKKIDHSSNENNDDNDETESLPYNYHALANAMYYIFCVFSTLVTNIPTSSLPMYIMFFTIILRLIPHCTKHQPSPPENSNHGNNTYFIMTIIQHYQFGLAYISIGFHYLLRICQVGGPIHIGNLLFIVWMSDTGALIIGRTISSSSTSRIENSCHSRDNSKPATSFLTSVSPGKTRVGLLGAIITGPISAVIYSSMILPSSPSSSSILKDNDKQQQCGDDGVISSFTSLSCFMILPNNPMIQQLILGLILSMAGIVGDLAESSVKRLSMKKDSGKLLPGHGGVVDRFDSLFVSAVVYYYWMLV